MIVFLHAGSGKKTYQHLPISLEPPEWHEVRLDIDPSERPDIVSSITDMREIANESFDAVVTSHTLEHLYPKEVYAACKEFLRVLKPEGFAVITCPDLQTISKLIAEGRLLEEMYNSPEGPVTPLDMLYGFRPAIAQGKTYMAHKTGFTLPVLLDSLKSAGFVSITGFSRPEHFDIWALATKNPVDDRILEMLKVRFLPKK